MPDPQTRVALTLRRRFEDIGIAAAVVVAAATAIALFYRWPAAIAGVCAVILLTVVARYHQSRDIAALVVWVVIGNAVELACDAAGVWRHADTSILRMAPAYIFLCYPTVGLTLSRATDAWVGELRCAGSQWRHDLAAGIAGTTLALAWEVPATMAGAWTFSSPRVFGLLPAWLPLACAMFFISMGRLTATAIDAMAETVTTRDGRSCSRWRTAPAAAATRGTAACRDCGAPTPRTTGPDTSGRQWTHRVRQASAPDLCEARRSPPRAAS
jgi:hypothetical protein